MAKTTKFADFYKTNYLIVDILTVIALLTRKVPVCIPNIFLQYK